MVVKYYGKNPGQRQFQQQRRKRGKRNAKIDLRPLDYILIR